MGLLKQNACCMTASISMSGVGARGDLCTATIVWFIMITHMLYSASDPEPWQSTVSYIMESNHSRLVPEIWIQLKSSPIFPVDFLFTGTGELNSQNYQSPMWVESIHTTGCWSVPRKHRLRYCCHHLCHAAVGTIPHTLATVEQIPVRRPRSYHPPRQGRLGFDFEGCTVQRYDAAFPFTAFGNNSWLNILHRSDIWWLANSVCLSPVLFFY
jgi:hypothetical protein